MYGVLFLATCSVYSTNLFAQLISPGELSTPHSFLDKISQCTSCHELRNSGISNDKCLTCHTPIQASMLNIEGLHGGTDIIDQNCASCHKEHFGKTFDVLHFDSTDFDHSITGFELENAHAEINCQSCHNEKSFLVDSVFLAYQDEFELVGSQNTFLGIDSECASCHSSDNIHADQFMDQSCSSCHSTIEFVGAEVFNHNNADFLLTGAHVDVECASCHTNIAVDDTLITQFVEIESENCSDCHEDIHDERLTKLARPPATCETCHSTEDWHKFDASFPETTFDHNEAGYALVGSHAELDCESCHSPRKDELVENLWVKGSEAFTYPEPVSEQCLDCHINYHEGVFEHSELESDCQNCHTDIAWYPSTFGLEAHNNSSQFPLLGAHVTTPCFSCHKPDDVDFNIAGNQQKPQFSFSDISCNSCHESDNPHGDLTNLWTGSQSEDCESCHTEQSWTSEIKFQHEEITGYALTGKHEIVTCDGCHFGSSLSEVLTNELSFTLESTECESCHQIDSPHQGQFLESVIGQSCDGCHTTNSFTLPEFDHTKTSFPLDGGHIGVTCIDCHITEATPDSTLFTRFFPISTECSTCHDN